MTARWPVREVPRQPTSKSIASESGQEPFQWFEPLTNTAKYSNMERYSLFAVLGVAVAGLLYAGMLVGQVTKADKGTPRMQEIAAAVREGANAYLKAQFSKIVPLILVITVLLYATKYNEWEFAVGRSGAFLMGSIFSALVGLCGMMLATTGNLRVAAAARHSYGEAMQLGYRTGTVTGMLTDGLGLLGGTCIFMVYGERAYEALLGFGFGGTLLALFMRVGGGIYTKAADVGADLVGKVEAGIPEDDPRNAATIADNVGDNVGRLRRHGGRHFRKLRSDHRRGDDPGHGQLRPQGRDFPAPGPRHRRAGLDHQHLYGEGRPQRHLGHGPEERPSRLLDRFGDLRDRLRGPGFRLLENQNTTTTFASIRRPSRATR